MKRSFSITAVALGVILIIASSCGTPRTTASGYPYPGSPYPYPGSPYPGTPYPGTPYPGSYPGSYPYPETYPAGRYPQRPVVVYKQPEKVYVPERSKEVVVEHRNDRKYNERDRRDHDRDHHDNDNHGNRRSNQKN